MNRTMKMSAARCTTDRIESHVWIWVVAFAVAVTSVGCKSGPKHPTERLVSIGTIAWDAFPEHEEIVMVFKTNGIQASFDGSKMHDIVVPQSQAGKAFTLLETNHLVLEKKVLLSRPPN